MLRKQIYLDAITEAALNEVSIAKGISQSEVIRQAVQEYVVKLKEERKGQENPLLKLIGIANSGLPDASEKHDKYLYGKDQC